jgi:hypothetical protein
MSFFFSGILVGLSVNLLSIEINYAAAFFLPYQQLFSKTINNIHGVLQRNTYKKTDEGGAVWMRLAPIRYI